MSGYGSGAVDKIKVGRQAVYTKGGVVSSQSSMATTTGVRVLSDGGNAFDAAIAMPSILLPICWA